ncbi:MAG: hypothetical protein ACP5KK_00485, partial [Candidatus Nanoarchaeia archaeon]
MAFLKHTTKKLVKKISAKKASATAVLLIFLALAGTIFVGKYFTGKATIGPIVPNLPLNITLNEPANNAQFTTQTINFSFTATDDLSSTLVCSIYLDNARNQTNYSVE